MRKTRWLSCVLHSLAVFRRLWWGVNRNDLHSKKHRAMRARGPAVIARTTRGSAIALAKPSRCNLNFGSSTLREMSAASKQQIHFAIVRLREHVVSKDKTTRADAIHLCISHTLSVATVACPRVWALPRRQLCGRRRLLHVRRTPQLSSGFHTSQDLASMRSTSACGSGPD